MDEKMNRRPPGTDFPVNGHPIHFSEEIVTGREVLTQSGNVPASEFQLILVHDRRTHLKGTDDKIELTKNAGGEFRAFQSDRSFGFTVDEVSQVWGTDEIEVDEFLKIWPPRDGHHWVLERDDDPDTVLTPGGVLSFGERGVEHVVSRKHAPLERVLVTVVTTAGTFPAEGAKRYPVTTLISDVLTDAARRLHLSGTEEWIVTVGGRDVSASLTFQQAGLSGQVALEWGAREGGGGA